MPADNVEELRLVVEYVELPFLLTILESNIKKMRESKFKLSSLFELHLRTMQDRVSKEQYRVRQEMRRRGIKVFEQHQLEDCITAKYLCKGVHTRRKTALEQGQV